MGQHNSCKTLLRCLHSTMNLMHSNYQGLGNYYNIDTVGIMCMCTAVGRDMDVRESYNKLIIEQATLI